MNVLIEILGKQFKAGKGDKLKVPYINKKIGEKLSFDKILYSDDGKKKNLGKPYLKDLQMEAKLLEHGKEDKIIVWLSFWLLSQASTTRIGVLDSRSG